MSPMSEDQFKRHLREKADQGFPTGWGCVECVLLWWSKDKRPGADKHAQETGHTIMLSERPFRLL